MDWYPSKREPKKIPKICIDEEDFDREEFYCGNCDCEGGGCDGVSLTRAHDWNSSANEIQGTQRMESLLECFIQHTKASRRLTKQAYDSKPKTIRLRKKASRAIASFSNRSAADSMKNHRAEHKRVIATNTLSCLIDISNILRHITQHGIPGCQELCVNAAGCQQVSVSHAGATNSDVSSGPSTAAEMPVRCGPDKMPDECLWDLPSDEDEDKVN
ncbi:hypothetical protein FOXYS1_11099 [Fusarium oxysporum]|uniref:Uncharacterized protein n=1 Tax=Fusarium oxysporum TaxID=5507 RepID=A0A8H5EF02_FUSOX|nr:hypothetical protein FOXYS1_11099 [Fusarium oxysporum]